LYERRYKIEKKEELINIRKEIIENNFKKRKKEKK
jgi:hypothetical protein